MDYVGTDPASKPISHMAHSSPRNNFIAENCQARLKYGRGQNAGGWFSSSLSYRLDIVVHFASFVFQLRDLWLRLRLQVLNSFLCFTCCILIFLCLLLQVGSPRLSQLLGPLCLFNLCLLLSNLLPQLPLVS